MKRLVKNEMKQELESMRNDSQGCTKKCKIKNKLLEVDIERHRGIVQALVNFAWCAECSNQGEAGAVKVMC